MQQWVMEETDVIFGRDVSSPIEMSVGSILMSIGFLRQYGANEGQLKQG